MFNSIARVVYKYWKRSLLLGRPCMDVAPVFVNSLPKSGTHLVTSILDSSGVAINSYEHIIERDFCAGGAKGFSQQRDCNYERLRKFLKRVTNGHYMTAHLGFDDFVMVALKDCGMNVVNVIRDPRDLAVSHAFYVLKNKYHFLHKSYKQMESFDDCLMASIVGIKESSGVGLESIDVRLDYYKDWLLANDVLTLRFEHIVGEKGGASIETFRDEVGRLLVHIGVAPSRVNWDHLEENFWGTKSNTFRKGKIGDWKNHFKVEHEEAFYLVAGNMLLTYGYE